MSDDQKNEGLSWEERDRARFTNRPSSFSTSGPTLGSGGFFGCLVVLAIIVVVLVAPITGVIWHSTSQTATCTVTDKSATHGSEGGGTDYRIYTDKCGTLGIGDDLFIGKWDSSDRYGAIQVGKTYELKSIGWRFPLMSTFPNIVESREVTK